MNIQQVARPPEPPKQPEPEQVFGRGGFIDNVQAKFLNEIYAQYLWLTTGDSKTVSRMGANFVICKYDNGEFKPYTPTGFVDVKTAIAAAMAAEVSSAKRS